MKALRRLLDRWRRRQDVEAQRITIEINGRATQHDVSPLDSLADLVRTACGYDGTKVSCGRGECGACTVLVGERPMMACTLLAAEVTAPVTTIEALGSDDLRAAFADAGAFQCGYCTPGQIVAAEALLRSGTPLDERAVRHALSGNICRCTGYAPIVDAVLATAAQRSEGTTCG